MWFNTIVIQVASPHSSTLAGLILLLMQVLLGITLCHVACYHFKREAWILFLCVSTLGKHKRKILDQILLSLMPT